MPAYARRRIVRDGEVGVYHCVHRCVRRAFLCGEDPYSGQSFEHRKAWVRERLVQLSGAFAADVCSYAVMSNHLHAVVRVRPDRAAGWDAAELARRWWRLFPGRRDERGRPADPSAEELCGVLDAHGGGAAREEELRGRLASLSWLMRCLAEPIARRANREDGCTGRFWEGRFKSQALLDEKAMLACAAYVDLNPIRAEIATTPEGSEFTSAKERIDARQGRQKAARLTERAEALPASQRSEAAAAARLGAGDRWLCPIGSAADYLPSLDLDGYLALLDWTGRQVVEGKRGVIPADLRPILERLNLEVERWADTVLRFGHWFRRAAGSLKALGDEALRLGQRWLHGVRHARLAFGET